MHLKSRFLRYVVYFYGNLTVQLFPLGNCFGLFNLMQNVLLFLLVAFVIFSNPNYNGGDRIQLFLRLKPVFGLFFQTVVWRLFPCLTIIKGCYYILYGERIVRLLDSDCLRRPYEGRARYYFSLVFLGNTLLFLTINLANIARLLFDASNQMSPTAIAFNIFLLYVMSSVANFHVFVTHYLLYSTYQNLLQINRQLSVKLSKDTENELISQFIQLTSLNREVFSLISFQLCISYLLSAVNSMVIIYLLAFIHFYPPLALYPLKIILYYAYLVNYNRKILALAGEIVRKLQNNQKGRFRATRRHVQLPNGQLANRPACRLIHRNELKLYLEYFKLNLFSNFAIIDRSLLFATALIILNYMVFIYQT